MSNFRTLNTDDLAGAFKALGHPHRLTMYLRLLGCCGGRRVCISDGEMGACVGELGEGLGVGAPTLSHHLKDLRAAGLIETSRRGQMVECQASVARLRDLAAFIETALEAVESAGGCCAGGVCGEKQTKAIKQSRKRSRPTTTGAQR